MSLRRSVNRSLIEAFLQRLGEHYRRPARLYLVGGTTLVYEGFRQQTLDIDLVIEVAAEDHGGFVQAVLEAQRELDINVEEASPADFIPLPGGFANRHIHIGTFGSVEAYHYDPYSTALSKIERGRRQDLIDVLLLLQNKRIDWPMLAAGFEEILPQMGQHSLRQKPEEFALNFRALQEMWRETGGIR